jgi:hypothetical protein
MSHYDQPVGELDKLGVTGSSPVPPTSMKAPLGGIFFSQSVLQATPASAAAD